MATSITPVIKLGSPAISEGSAKDLRATIGVLGNIRQRIEALERSLTTVNSVAVASSNTNSTQLNSIRQQIAQILQLIASLQAVDDDLVTLTAGETIAFGQGVVPISTTTVGVADPDDPTRMFGVIGLATSTANSGASVAVRRRGLLSIPSAAFLVGRAVYLDASGLTQTPDYNVTALPIGVATSTTQLYIAPEWPALLTPLSSSSGVEEVFESYLPVTYRLLLDTLDLAAQIAALPYSSGLDPSAMVPVEIGGVAYRVFASDFGGGSTDLGALIAALPYSSGPAPTDWFVPVENGGFAYRFPVDALVSVQALLDSIGATRGSILYRGASGWAILAPGVAGLALVSNGAGADPSYQSVSASGADVSLESIMGSI
jgi:hypothetical protein